MTPNKRLEEIKKLSDREIAELQLLMAERTRKNTGATADLLGIFLLLSAVGAVLVYAALMN